MSRIARAQAYPTRPVRIVVGFAAGGSADILARLIGQWLSERLGQPFVIENRPGAGTNIGTEAVVRAPADGYTLLLASPPAAINATLYEKLNFNFIRDIAPIASVIRAPFVMEINPSVPAKTVPEFIAYANSSPGKVSMASAGIGTGPHLAGELFKIMASTKIVVVHYRGTGPRAHRSHWRAGPIVFRRHSGFYRTHQSWQTARAGRDDHHPFGIVTRNSTLERFPTGLRCELLGWDGRTQKNTANAVIDRLNQAINTALTDPKIKARFADLGGTVLTGPPADFGKHIAAETEKWGKVIRAANIKAE